MPSFGFPIASRKNIAGAIVYPKPNGSTQRGISIKASASESGSGSSSKDNLRSKVGFDSSTEETSTDISMDEAKEKALEKLRLEKELEAEIQKQQEKKKKEQEDFEGDVDGVNLFNGVLGIDDDELPESVKHVDIEDSFTEKEIDPNTVTEDEDE